MLRLRLGELADRQVDLLGARLPHGHAHFAEVPDHLVLLRLASRATSAIRNCVDRNSADGMYSLHANPGSQPYRRSRTVIVRTNAMLSGLRASHDLISPEEA